MLEVGQVLVLKIRFNNEGRVSDTAHPYFVVSISNETVEIAQCSSLKGKERKAAFRSNKVISCDNPKETVIDTDSYVQLDNKFTIENFVGLDSFRRQKAKLSDGKLQDLINAYYNYHARCAIDENKIVYMDANEIMRLNR